MEGTQYWQIEEKVDELFLEKRYSEALELLNRTLERFPENLFEIVWYKAIIYTQVQDYQECLNTIEFLLEQGFVCPLHWGWFDPLRDDAVFRRLDQENNHLHAQVQKKAKMEYEVHLPEGYVKGQAYSLFIALHGDGSGGNIQDFGRFWKPDMMLKRDFIVVYIQSSQFLYTHNFGWLPDHQIAKKDIRDCYDRVCAQYTINRDNVIIGGFSGGAITSLEVTMANLLPVRGFVGLCVGLKPSSFTKENAELALKRGVKGVLMEGETAMPVADLEEIMQVFQEIGFPYQFYINQGMGHWFPQDLDEKLERAITYIVD